MTVVCGHTHMPVTRLAYRRQIVDPGSVGMPYGRQGAHWALLADGAVTMRSTAYDATAACVAVWEQSSSYPERAAELIPRPCFVPGGTRIRGSVP